MKTMKEKWTIPVQDWLKDYVDFVGNLYDLKISEVVRAYVCVGICAVFKESFGCDIPSIEEMGLPKLDPKKAGQAQIDEETFFRFLYNLLYHTRKNVEQLLPPQVKK